MVEAGQPIEAFLERLRQNSEAVLGQTELVMDRAGVRPPDEIDIAIYVNAILRSPILHGQGIDGEAGEGQALTIPAFISAEQVALMRLRADPTSLSAQQVLEKSFFAPPESHHRLLHEMWPEVKLVLGSLR